MSFDADDSGIDVEIVDDVGDDWQRRQYLKQIYESVKRTREAFLNRDIERDREAYMMASSALFDTLRLARPLLDDTPQWTDRSLGTVEVVEKPPQQPTKNTTSAGGDGLSINLPRNRSYGQPETRERDVRGLADVFALEDGYETIVEKEAPGNTSATTQEKVRKPLPPHILRSAFDAVIQALHDQDVLTHQSGEPEGRADRGDRL